MSENHTPQVGAPGMRSARLTEDIEHSTDELSTVVGLPDHIEPGVFGFTYMADPWRSGELVAQKIQFDWQGGSWTTWTQDISGDEAISPGSSAPVVGWASWQNGNDLLVAFSSDDLDGRLGATTRRGPNERA